MAVDDIVLTLFSRSEYAVVKSWFKNQAQLTQWGGPAVRHPLDDSQLDGMLSLDPVRLSWMARRGDTVIGHAQAFSIDTETGIARLGRIVIAPAHRGRGLAVPMLRRVLEQLFATAGVERVDLGVYLECRRTKDVLAPWVSAGGASHRLCPDRGPGVGSAGDVAHSRGVPCRSPIVARPARCVLTSVLG